MIRPNSCIYLVSTFPMLNEESVTPLGKIDRKHTSQLYANLILNHKENLNPIINNTSVIYCFDRNDREHLPAEISNTWQKNISPDSENPYQHIKNIADKHFSSFNNNLIIFSNSIGFSPSDLKKTLDLLTIESEAVIIGKSSNGGVSFIGFNYLNLELIRDIHWNGMEYENLLHKVNKYDNFVYVRENSLVVQSEKDFKSLYAELSKKESLNYCSQQMHEKFTHIFIEYKELLK